MDKYDEAIAYLKEHPLSITIRKAWNDPSNQRGGCLFERCVRNYAWNDTSKTTSMYGYGCLTQIRLGDNYWQAETAELTEKIRNDERIPKSADDITVDNLYVFAEWQRKLDAELIPKKEKTDSVVLTGKTIND